MKKLKNWLVFIVVIALLCGAVAVFSIGNEDDDPKKENNVNDDVDNKVDTEDGTELPEDNEPKLVTFNFCSCEGCQECLPDDFDIFAKDETEGENLLGTELYTGTEVTFCINSSEIAVSTTGFYNAEFYMGGLDYRNEVLKETYYIWDNNTCVNKNASASAVSFNMRRPETTASNLNADAGEQIGDEDWTPFY